MFFKKIFALSFAMLILSSCVETVVVGTVAAGAYVAGNRNKSIPASKKNNYILDNTETMSLKDYLKNNPNKKGLKNVNVNVFEKIIMLTGYVNNSNLKTLVGGIAKSKKPNNEIINEIMVFDNDYNVSSFRDSVISFRISWKLKGASEIHSNNYKYDVVDGNVFIIGLASDKEELKKTTNIISQINGVKKVVSYIKINN